MRLPYAGVDWRGRRYFENLQAYKNNSYWKISPQVKRYFSLAASRQETSPQIRDQERHKHRKLCFGLSFSLACPFLGIKKHLAKSIQLFYILLCNQDMTLSCGLRVKIYFSYSFTLSGEKATFQCALKTRYSLWLLQNNFSCKAKTHFLVKLFF